MIHVWNLQHASTHIGLFHELQTTKVQFSVSPANKSRKSIILKLASRMYENAYFRRNFAKVSRGHALGPTRIVVASALSLKLICDATRLWRNFTPSEIFSVRHWWQPRYCIYDTLWQSPSVCSNRRTNSLHHYPSAPHCLNLAEHF